MDSVDTSNMEEDTAVSLATEDSAMDKNVTSIAISLPSSLRYYLVIKRVFDIVFSIVGIVLLFPVFLIIAACVKLHDGGSILYFREMVGLHGRSFTIFKFRTMIPNADTYLEMHPELHLEYRKSMKLQLDPRVTPLGKFLRKTYLDELPQLFNILLGHMSFVGPRAIHERELILYTTHVEKRCTVRPGLTGLWQISPDRHNHYEARIPLDMRYIDTYSFFLDCLILLKTLKVFILTTGV